MVLHMMSMEVDTVGQYGVLSDDARGLHMVVLFTKDEDGGGFHVAPVEQHMTYAEASLRAEHLNGAG